MGTFELVVLFVTDSPIDGNPCDELECCGPFVVFMTLRPVLELQIRRMAVQTWKEGWKRTYVSFYKL